MGFLWGFPVIPGTSQTLSCLPSGSHPWWAGAAVGDGDGRELRELLEQIPTAGVGHLGDRKHVFFWGDLKHTLW